MARQPDTPINRKENKLKNIHSKCTGRFKLKTENWESDWFDNLVLDSGLNMLGSLNNILTPMSACQLGTDDSPVSKIQTSLGAYLTGSSTIASDDEISGRISPYYIGRLRSFTFAAGTIGTDIKELGVSTGPISTDTLFSRAILPKPVKVLSDESLTVYYEFKFFLSESEVTLTDIIAGVQRAITIKPARIDEVTFGSSGKFIYDGTCLALENSTLGNITGIPTSTSSASGDIDLLPYVPGTFYRDIKFDFDLSQGNLTDGISGLYNQSSINNSEHPCLQLNINPGISKTKGDIYSTTIRYSWGRVN